jgi:transaldolase
VTAPLAELATSGVSVWLDDLSRARLDGGSLTRLVESWHVTGVTTNPTIFANAITGSDLYDAQLRDLAARGLPAGEALRALTTEDVRQAADVLRPVYEATGGRDGFVSIEVDPRLAHDTDATARQARLLWRQVDRPNLFVKIPATPAGLPAIRTSLAEGLNVNVTLLFGPHRHRQVLDAFLDGMHAARAAGHDLTRIASVASLFVSRLDTAIDALLDENGSKSARTLRGAAALANAHLVQEQQARAFTSERWASLARDGARPQRLLWASTGVKDPAYDDTRYVTGLAVPGSIATMPEATLRAVADHGHIPSVDTADQADRARRTMTALRGLGIDVADVVQRLEDDGVAAFSASWDQLTRVVEERLQRLRTATAVRT